jgi:hypothetical protein
MHFDGFYPSAVLGINDLQNKDWIEADNRSTVKNIELIETHNKFMIYDFFEFEFWIVSVGSSDR